MLVLLHSYTVGRIKKMCMEHQEMQRKVYSIGCRAGIFHVASVGIYRAGQFLCTYTHSCAVLQ